MGFTKNRPSGRSKRSKKNKNSGLGAPLSGQSAPAPTDLALLAIQDIRGMERAGTQRVPLGSGFRISLQRLVSADDPKPQPYQIGFFHKSLSFIVKYEPQWLNHFNTYFYYGNRETTGPWFSCGYWLDFRYGSAKITFDNV